MAERFRDPIKAAQYISQGLHHDFPDAVADVVRTQRGKPKSKSCVSLDYERILVEMCKGLGEVLVDYHPANAYGYVAQIRQDLSVEGDANGRSPQRVYVVIRTVKGRDIAVGTRLTGRPALELE